MLDRLDDTIVAVSSAPGYGPVGIVRLSGNDSIRIADRVSVLRAEKALADQPGSTHVSGEVLFDRRIGIPATFYVFRAPRSYTRQDIVEIYTVGSPAVLDCLRLALIELGAVQALPGEFTARAFLSGAMDLAEAEGVAGLIRARSDTQLRASRRMMDGVASEQIKVFRDELAELLGLVEADIDFVEEPIEFIAPAVLSDRLGSITTRLRDLCDTSTCVERFNNLPHILMLGQPNAGKSSLMNRLSGTPRAICAAAAGTTRDVLSAPIRLDRGEAILLDAAGVDGCLDDLATLAREGTLAAAEHVDVVCVVFDLTVPINVEFVDRIRRLAMPRTLVVANKCDLVSPKQAAETSRQLGRLGLGPVCLTSALDGAGIDGLRRALTLATAEQGGTTLGESVLISERQVGALQGALTALKRAADLAQSAEQTADCADILAFELRDALDQLGAVSGDVATEDLLSQVFANFCIGK